MKTGFIIVTSLVIGLGTGWIIFYPSASEPNNVPMVTSDSLTQSKFESAEPANRIISIDPGVVQKIGVRVDTVKYSSLTKTIRAVGKLTVNETKQQSVNSKVMGWVEKLHTDFTGKPVYKGQPLLDIYSPELVSTQEEYLQATDHEKAMSASISQDAKSGAAGLANSAKRRLQNWDISEKEIALLAQTRTIKKTMTLFSPVNGFIIEKMVVEGQNVMSGMELFRIADLTTIWVMTDIYEHELPWISVGQDAVVRLSYAADRSYHGKVTFIQPILNEETRTATIRIEIPNTSGSDLKPGMFATVEILSASKKKQLIIDDQSVIKTGEKKVVIISTGDGKFDPRLVETGLTADGKTEILSGIKSGELYVTSSQFLIDSESNIKTAISQMLNHNHAEIGSQKKSATISEQGKYVWVCPMHPDIVREKPGTCPKCKMDLVKKFL